METTIFLFIFTVMGTVISVLKIHINNCDNQIRRQENQINNLERALFIERRTVVDKNRMIKLMEETNRHYYRKMRRNSIPGLRAKADEYRRLADINAEKALLWEKQANEMIILPKEIKKIADREYKRAMAKKYAVECYNYRKREVGILEEIRAITKDNVFFSRNNGKS